jgi:hypothetical protein
VGYGGGRRGEYRVLVEDPGIDGRIILKVDLQEVGCEGH